MMRFVSVALLSFVFAACLTLGQSEASGCRVVQLYAPPTVAYTPPVNYGHQRNYDLPFYGSTFVPFPVFFPSYTVQYPGGGGADQATLAAIKRLEDALAALTAKYEGIRPPAAAPAPMPEAGPASAAAGPGEHVRVLKRCANCHDAGVAKNKGEGFVLAENGKTRQLTPAEGMKCLQRVEDDEMPPGNPLSEADKKAFRRWVIGSKKG